MLRCALNTAMLIALCTLGSTSRSQDTAAKQDQSQAKEWAERASQLALAEARAYEFHLGKDQGLPLKLVEQPVLKWSNTYEASVYGNVFVWTRSGRPQVIASIFKFFSPKVSFDGEFHSLAAGPIRATKQDENVWQPAEGGIELKPLADAAAPAKSRASRLTQMRELARSFSAEVTTVIEPKTKHRLRLLPQPLYRYGGESEDLLDGALFAFARETDPDVVLMIEARGDKPPRWEFALARMHVGALSARYHDKEIWSVGEHKHPYLRKSEPYTLFQDLREPKLDRSRISP